LVSQDIGLLFYLLSVVLRIVLDQVQNGINIAFAAELEESVASSLFGVGPQICFFCCCREDVEA